MISKASLPYVGNQPKVAAPRVAASAAMPPKAQALQHKPALPPPPVYRPAPSTRPAPPPVYSPNSKPAQAQRKTAVGTPPVYRPTPSARLVPPSVYSPAPFPTLQRMRAGVAPPAYRPGFGARPASGAAGVIQRNGGTNPKKPRYKLAEFAVEVQQTIADHFKIPRKAFRLKEHCSSDFAVSSFAQQVMYEQILYPSLPFDAETFKRSDRDTLVDALAKRNPEVAEQDPDVVMEQWLDEITRASASINGLTTEDPSGPIVHVRQDDNLKKMQCTLIHEAMHAYSHNAFKGRYEKDMDEGMTELLALEIMAQFKGLTDTRSVMKVYTSEKRAADALVRNYGAAAAQNAYFNGSFSPTMPLNKAGLPVA